jgi:hypothetical protein
VRQKHLWNVIIINGDPDDPERSTRVPLEWAKEMIATYGRDSPFIKVMLLGEWPTASLNALIGPDEVEAAMKRVYRQQDIDHAARVLGIDVARFGDDASVIYPRQGLVAFKPLILRSVDGNQGAGRVSRIWDDWQADAAFIDNGGGYGASWIDALARFNRHPIPIDFNGSPQDRRYYNRRSEMYFTACQWIKDGGALLEAPPEIVAELSQTSYAFKGDRLIIEPKEAIKVKIGRSPDVADGFCLSFADPVVKRQQEIIPVSRPKREYDPFQQMMR